LNHFWPKNITGGPQVSKILEKWHILSSKPPKIINIDILNNFGFWTLHKVLKYMGEDDFIIFWTQKDQFQGEYRGALKAPPTRKCIFSTPPGIGLSLTLHWHFFTYEKNIALPESFRIFARLQADFKTSLWHIKLLIMTSMTLSLWKKGPNTQKDIKRQIDTDGTRPRTQDLWQNWHYYEFQHMTLTMKDKNKQDFMTQTDWLLTMWRLRSSNVYANLAINQSFVKIC